MTDANASVFEDRRTEDEKNAGLATPILLWYDTEQSPVNETVTRRRVSAIAVGLDGTLRVARATCSEKDQFVKAKGRLVVKARLVNRAQKHSWTLDVQVSGSESFPEAAARAYRSQFPDDEAGHKRAYNAGKVYEGFSRAVERAALDR